MKYMIHLILNHLTQKKSIVDNFVHTQDLKNSHDNNFSELATNYSKEIDKRPISYKLAKDPYTLKNTEVIIDLSKVYNTWINSENLYSQSNNLLTNINNKAFYEQYCKDIDKTVIDDVSVGLDIINNPNLLKMEDFRCNPHLNNITGKKICNM